MKKLTLVLVLLIPLLAFAQEPLPRVSEKATTKSVFGKNHIIQPLKKMDDLQKDFSVNSISEKIKQLQAEEEEELKKSYREIFPGREIIERLRENRLKSAQADTMLNDSVYIFTFKSPTDSVLTGKMYGTYNTKGNFGQIWRLGLDTLTMQWRNTSKDDYFYDENDMNTSIVQYTWDVGKNDWIPVFKREMEYDTEGRRTMMAYYDWNNYSKKWIGRTKYEYAFDERGNRVMYAVYDEWYEATGTWTGYYKMELAFNEEGKQTLYAYYEWNYSTKNWQGYFKREMTYDDMGNMISRINSGWNEMDGKWVFLEKEELVFGQDGPIEMAYYWWNQSNEKWIGQYKEAIFTITETEQYSISYSWNNQEETWAESEKSVFELLNDGLTHHFTSYYKQDSIVPGILINGFNTEDDINNVWTDLSCPEQTCSVLDSDFVEGAASIRWDYHSTGKINYWGGACQFEMLNSADLTGFDGISLNYKVLESSLAYFVFILIESDGEVWEYSNYELPRDSSDIWKELAIPFNNMYPRNYVDGYLNLENIGQILIQAFSEWGMENSGVILLDNLSACTIVKSKQWKPEYFGEEIYDENDNLVSATESRWDPYLQEFIVSFKYKSEMVYDDNGKLTDEETYNWDEYMGTEDWKNSSKRHFEYDEFGNQTLEEFYYWDEYNNKWIGGNKSERSFDENGNVLSFVSYGWDYWQGRWNPEYKEENTFVGDSIQASHVSYYYDSNLRKWIGNNKYETVYNDALEAIKEMNYEWNHTTGVWKITHTTWIERNKYQYDSEDRLQAYVRETWDETLNQWCPKTKYYYFWSLHSITKAELVLLNPDEKVVVYPNPATDVICIKLNPGNFSGTLSLFNSNGLLLKISELTGNITSVPVNDLPKGNYILHIKTDEFVESKKIIVQ
ncbi:MAG: T9SS type A sorting domain-containing protein [Mariniphaga sp.]|nr:T9SS type A sorting domain-containing protein [Mariniphaga sp.]